MGSPFVDCSAQVNILWEAKTVQRFTLLSITSFMLVLIVGDKTNAEPPRARAVRIVEKIHNSSPPFYIKLNVDRPTRVYEMSDRLTATVTSSADGFLYLFYRQSNDQIVCLFPNRNETDCRIRKGQSVQVPGPQASFEMVIDVPLGQESLIAVVCKQKLPIEDARRKAISPKETIMFVDDEAKGIRLNYLEDLGSNLFAVDRVRIHTVPKGTIRRHAEQPRERQRRALIVGISAHMHDEITHLPACRNDATQIGRILTSQLGKENVVILIDAQATLANVRQQFDRLVRSTQPGDDIIIYWSGHGQRSSDDDGDEKDGLEEFLVTYDSDIRDVDSIRRTMLSDDEFGNLLLRLFGRRIVVFLDACYSGGQAKGTSLPGQATKGLGAAGTETAFDFIDGEINALAKDIKQKNVAVICSSTADQVSFVCLNQGMSVMSFFIHKNLKTHESVTLRNLFNDVSQNVAAYVKRFFGAQQTLVWLGDQQVNISLSKTRQ